MSYLKIKHALGVLLVLCSFLVQAQSSRFKLAEKNFANLSYVEAVRHYEAFLVKSDDNKQRQTALEHLAFSYRKLQDFRNAERVYEELFEGYKEELPSEAFLYYAQTLASNENYRESQKYYSKYAQRQREDLRGGRFTIAYMDRTQFYKDSSLYRIQYVDAVNSRQADFSPMYFEDGLVFVSARDEGGVIKRIFKQNETPFLDLFLFPDTTLLQKGTLPLTASLSGAASSGEIENEDEWRDKLSIENENDTESFDSKLNSKYHEGPVTFFQDYEKLIFTRNNYSKGRARKSKDGVTLLKLYSSEKGSKKWGNIKELPFNSDNYSCGHPALNPEDNRLYFVSDMPGGQGGTDIYFVDYKDGEWGSPINLGKEVNTAGNELFPFIDENGNLYFASDGHAGLGGLDIFFSELYNGIPREDPTNLGYPVNSEKDDFGLITDGDRTEGYFSSNRKRGFSDDNIYGFRRRCRELKLLVYDAETGFPVNNADVRMVQGGVNKALFLTNSTGEMTTCIATATDFEFKVFAEGYQQAGVSYGTMSLSQSNRAEIKIYLHKSKLPIVRGTIRSEMTNQPIAGARVTLRNKKDDSVVTLVTGGDGKYEFQPTRSGKYFVSAVKQKYATNTERVGRVRTNSKRNIAYEQNLGMIAEGDIFRIRNIYYDFGKASIRPSAKKALDKEVIPVLQKYPTLTVEIRSHTDSRSGEEFNKKLSDSRAQSVTDYLIKRGISRERLISRGYGETLLVNGCSDGVNCAENEHQKNRRTEFKILAVNDVYGSTK